MEPITIGRAFVQKELRLHITLSVRSERTGLIDRSAAVLPGGRDDPA